jgi:hypothetical protein
MSGGDGDGDSAGASSPAAGGGGARSRRRAAAVDGEAPRRGVVWDETNLRENYEWQQANPVTMRIDEPKTEFVFDDGKFSEDDDDEKHHDQHHDGAGGDEQTKKAGGTAAAAASGSDDGVKQDQQLAGVDGTRKGGKNGADDESGSWHNVDFNRIGREALRNNPIVFTAVAPTNAVGTSDLQLQQRDPGEPGSAGLKNKPAGLSLHTALLSEDAQIKAEQARHEAEFKVMRTAVYKDEGAKFREMMLRAKQQQNDDDDDDVDEDG